MTIFGIFAIYSTTPLAGEVALCAGEGWYDAQHTARLFTGCGAARVFYPSPAQTTSGRALPQGVIDLSIFVLKNDNGLIVIVN